MPWDLRKRASSRAVSLREPRHQGIPTVSLLDVDKPLVLWDRLAAGEQRLDVLLDGLADVALGLLDRLAVAEAAGRVGL